MKASKNNNWQGNSGFLSELSKGRVHAEIPDGCQYSDGGPEQEEGPLIETRIIGARSGVGKKTTVV